MGIFGRQDELFELMNKQNRGGSRRSTPSAQTSGSTSRPLASRPRLGTGFGSQDDLLEVDGDALVVIDDDMWDATAETEPGEESESGGLLSLRFDTAAVGGAILAGVVAVAFLMGRASGGPAETTPQVVEVAVTDAAAPTPSDSPAQAQPMATTVPVSARSGEATTMTRAPRAEPATTPAAAAVRGKHELIVVATSAEKAKAMVEWLNTNPRSPIFGRTDLQAFARKGGVRIRGFATRESDVARRVRATTDPTNGGSGTFDDAYYVKAR